jgi:hypothetical protein
MSNDQQKNSSPDTMTELYFEAFAKFGIRALWSMRRVERPTIDDALAVARTLRIEGELKARQLAEDMGAAARASH